MLLSCFSRLQSRALLWQANPPLGVKCKVEVKSKPVALIANHLFIVYTNATGTYFYRGGPSGDGITSYGTIVTDSGLYLPGTIDYVRRAPSVTAAESSAACVGTCFDSTSNQIESANIPYGVFTPNSNSVIRTLLHSCTIQEVKPNVWAPGWETYIL